MLLFLAKLTLAWLAFAGLYATVLRGLTFHRANRLYLLAALGLGLAYAVLPLHVAAAVDVELGAVAASAQLAERLPAIRLVRAEELLTFDPWAGRLHALWLAGVLLAVARLAWGLARLYALIPGVPFHRLADGSVVVRTGAVRSPFSFFRWIFVPADFAFQNPDTEAILTHERAHARHGHSVDVVFAEALCIALWFHPLAHWFRRSLALVHEYEADADTARALGRRSYGDVLLRQAGYDGLVVTSGFLHGSLKRRIDVLVRPRSLRYRAVHYATLLPVLVVLGLVHWESLAAVRDGAWELDHQPLAVLEACAARYEQTALGATTVAWLPPTSGFDRRGRRFYRHTDVPPAFRGDWPAYVHTHARALAADLPRELLPAIVFARFIVERDGSIQDIHALTPSDYHFAGYARFQRTAERLLQEMPPWQPARIGHDTVRSEVVVKIEFGF